MSVKNYIKRGLRFIFKGAPIIHTTANVVTLAPNELLNGRVALITGGTSGIGFYIAKHFLNSGATVIITGRNEKRIKQACDMLRSSTGCIEKVYGHVLDNTCVESFEPALQKISSQWNLRIDILVNNAGVLGGDISNVAEEQYDMIMDTNLKGTFLVTKAVTKYMMKKRSGKIINMTSVSGIMGNIGQTNYSAAKAGVIGFTKSLAREMASRGITVNAVAPGFIATDMTAAMPEKAQAQVVGSIPLGKMGQPEDIANAVVFLASDKASYITGQVVNVDGGMVM